MNYNYDKRTLIIAPNYCFMQIKISFDTGVYFSAHYVYNVSSYYVQNYTYMQSYWKKNVSIHVSNIVFETGMTIILYSFK